MIRLEHVDKYYNRKKKNEIHVINDTSLTLENKGLVALLGPSGCGKTTLLNAIGGLDKVNGGTITVQGERITGRRSGKVDEIRNLHIGYIFQNYNLVDEMTVFDNVAMVLKMTGVRSASEIRSKVNYALSVVGMYRYRNRYADMLSGGERQRVGIARAIVKDPPVIIADEPTGNLDSRNTIDVMNIIKSISRSRLVILVTHEEELASFYASRIIRISDGRVISDEKNEKSDALDYRIDNNIYLGDIKEHETFRSRQGRLDLYGDGEAAVDLKLVVRGGNIYIRSDAPSYRVELLDGSAGIRLVDGKYREMTQEDFFANQFDPRRLKRAGEARYTSIISLLEMIKGGFRKVTEYKPVKKVLLVGFFISAMFVMYALCNIAGVLQVDDSKFITVNRDYLKIVGKHITPEEYEGYASLDGVDYLMPGTSRINMMIPYDDFIQTNGQSEVLGGSLSSINNISKKDLTAGRMPRGKQEIVIDRLAAQRFIKGTSQYQGMDVDLGSTAKMAGISTPGDLLGRRAVISGMPAFIIVGLTDQKQPCIYADPSQFMDMIIGSPSDSESQDLAMGAAAEDLGDEAEENPAQGRLVDYQDYSFRGGVKPVKDYTVVVSAMYKEDMPLNKTIDRKVNGHKLKVVGYYEDGEGQTKMLVNGRTLRFSAIESKSGISVYGADKKYLKSQLAEMGVNVEDPYAKAKANYQKSRRETVRSALILALVVLAISIIEIFLIMRASFLSRIREVGVLRAIGVKKRDIRRIFLGEILAVTCIADVPGSLMMAYIVSRMKDISYLTGNYMLNPLLMVLCLLLLLAVNILFGLLPVHRLLVKTPAEILARSDAGRS